MQHNIDLSKVSGSGPKGITKGDMLEFLANPENVKNAQLAPVAEPVASPTQTPASTQTAPTPTAPIAQNIPPPTPAAVLAGNHHPDNVRDLEVTQIRSVIAKRLTESKTTIPHQYTKISCEMSNIINLRKTLKAQNIKVSVNDFIIKAVAMSLKKNPALNQVLAGANANVSETVDISVAVATDAGLITPIVKSADGLGLSDISSTVADLAGRAKAKKLLPEEFMGGSFTISNLGMFGIREFSAVINPPQVCIMAVDVGWGKTKFFGS